MSDVASPPGQLEITKASVTMRDSEREQVLDALKKNMEEYLNTVWKTFAALLLILGWLVSSRDSRALLSSGGLWLATVLITMIQAGAYLGTLLDLYSRSKKLMASCTADSSNGPWATVAAHWAIPRAYPPVSFIVGFSLHLGIIAVVVNETQPPITPGPTLSVSALNLSCTPTQK